MKKILKTVLIVIASILVLGIVGGSVAFVATGNATNADEYKLDNDTIKSIKAVVEERKVTSVSTSKKNGVTTKKIEYTSDTVQDDLIKYVQYLRNDAGFILTKDMNLSVTPSTVELGKNSTDSEKIILMTIDYNSFGYTIIIQKGVGTLVTH